MRLDKNPIFNPYKRVTDSILDAKQFTENKKILFKIQGSRETKENPNKPTIAGNSMQKIVGVSIFGAFYSYHTGRNVCYTGI